MRELDISSNKHVVVRDAQEVSEHHYYIIGKAGGHEILKEEFGFVDFQDGPIQEVGVNGCQNEDLIAIVIDRLRYFQAGKFSCRENAIALTHLEDALHWLEHRTRERAKRGVEGKMEV